MPRRNNRSASNRSASNRSSRKRGKGNRSLPPRELPRDGTAFIGAQTVDGPRWTNGEPFVMRYIGSAAATKFYVCPGCNQNIPPGVAHVVAWPRDTGGRGEDRRHWHRHCWERR